MSLLKRSATFAALAGAISLGCGDDPLVQFPTVTVNARGEGSGSGIVQYELEPGVVRSCEPSPTSECFEFQDAGLGGTVSLTAVPNAGSVFGAWGGCETVAGTTCFLGFDNAPATLTATVRFDLEAANSCPNITVPARNTLAVVTGPRSGPATPVPNDPSAWSGTNYLVNADFDLPVYSGGGPTATGYWAFDQAWSAPSGQQAIVAQSGGRMLHFVTSSPDGTNTAVGSASEQIQLVDVSALGTRIDAGQVAVQARAFFNRVSAGGCTRIDNAFGIRVSAHSGIPTDYNEHLAFGQDNITADDDAASWQDGLASLTLPAGTRYVAVRVFINEGTANNDEGYPEFHGHYADNVSLSVQEVL